jgi:hypothetical protein
MTLYVDYNGWYEDVEGKPQRLSDQVLRVLHTMEIGQKVLIVESIEYTYLGEGKEECRGETRVWFG